MALGKDVPMVIEIAPGIQWDPDDYCIARAGQQYLLSACSARIFAELAQHPNRVLSESRLLAVGWPGEVRGREDLYKQICGLRHIVEDNPHHPRWILTRRNLGYEFHITRTQQ